LTCVKVSGVAVAQNGQKSATAPRPQLAPAAGGRILMPGSEPILFATIWGLLLIGLFFALRARIRKSRQRRNRQKP